MFQIDCGNLLKLTSNGRFFTLIILGYKWNNGVCQIYCVGHGNFGYLTEHQIYQCDYKILDYKNGIV